MKIGIVTLCAQRGKKRENLEKIVHFGRHAADAGCCLVVFPEYSVNGPWVTYDPAARLEGLLADAEPIPGPTTDLLASHAEQLRISLCVGLAEKNNSAKPFNTQVVINTTGVIHTQRKLRPTISEIKFYQPGGGVAPSTVSTFTLNNRRIGIIICADNGNPAIHDLLYEDGARIFLAPHAGAIKKFEEPGDSWTSLIQWHRKHRLLSYRRIAQTYGVTNVYFDLKDPRTAFNEQPDWIHYVSGKSAVFGPDGECVAENAGNEECLVVADV